MTRERVLNAFNCFGDDMKMRISGVGEFATSWPLFGPVSTPLNPFRRGAAIHRRPRLVLPAAQSVPGRGPADRDDLRGGECGDADREPALVGAHVPQIDQPTVNRFKALGAGIAVHPYAACPTRPMPMPPPVRMILDSATMPARAPTQPRYRPPTPGT